MNLTEMQAQLDLCLKMGVRMQVQGFLTCRYRINSTAHSPEAELSLLMNQPTTDKIVEPADSWEMNWQHSLLA
jgi:hypothetical protein